MANLVLLKKFKDKEMMITRYISPIGILLISISILLNYIAPDLGSLAFLEGMMLGIAIVFLLISVYFIGYNMRKKQNRIPTERKNKIEE